MTIAPDHAGGDALDPVVTLIGVRERADGCLVVRDADVEAAFSNAVRRQGGLARRRAKVLSRGDRALAKDLVQEAWLKLWEIDPLRFDLDHREDRTYVRASIVNHMRDVARKELDLRAGRAIVRVDEELA
jgi:DNA-directed RNA polymerase specialized sigma24 family protein